MRDRAFFGPGGNSDSFAREGHKHTYEAPEWLRLRGLDAYEYQGGNGITAGDAALAVIGKAAKEANIKMSVHAPYFISLSGVETEKRLKSLDYIQRSVEAAQLLGADTIVIHAGSASKITREEAMALARDTLTRAADKFCDSGVFLGIETMGKQNQLGTLDEVIELCKTAPCLRPVVDFGHLNARNVGGLFVTSDDYRRVFDKIGNALGDDVAKYLHCHFSKIEYTSAGEKKHLTFDDTVYGPDFEPLCELLAKDNLCPCIICESAGTMAEDAATMKKAYESYRG